MATCDLFCADLELIEASAPKSDNSGNNENFKALPPHDEGGEKSDEAKPAKGHDEGIAEGNQGSY